MAPNPFYGKICNNEIEIFRYVSLDLFGPMMAKPGPKSRVTRATKNFKIWGMVIVDLVIGAVAIYPLETYSTASFLSSFQTHVNIRGPPQYIYSDKGTQLASGRNILFNDEDDGDQIELDKLQDMLGIDIEWDMCGTGEQWKNGKAEAAVKSVKKLLKSSFQTRDMPALTWNTWWEVLTGCADLLNQRPLSLDPIGDDYKVITPNTLLLGNNGKSEPKGLYDYRKMKYNKMLETVENTKVMFFQELKKMMISGEIFTKYHKWYDTEFKPQVGDIILVVNKEKLITNYRYGKILEISEDNRNLLILQAYIQIPYPLLSFKTASRIKISIHKCCFLYRNS